MKYFIALVVLAIAIAEINAECQQQSDCPAGYCCKKVTSYTSPNCFPMLKKGEKCSVKDNIIYGIYQFRCPCEEGLSCTQFAAGIWEGQCN
ncbi:venom protein 164-like [Centruroides vittatus]|uniref:venom protein 164-like n=1 Tax=Centruroides vittatus TaxID=120091 RepID=UPI00350FF0CA